MAMNFEPIIFVWVVCLILSVICGYAGFGKKALYPLYVALGYTAFWLLLLSMVAFEMLVR